jgi:hypothetical protein
MGDEEKAEKLQPASAQDEPKGKCSQQTRRGGNGLKC